MSRRSRILLTLAGLALLSGSAVVWGPPLLKPHIVDAIEDAAAAQLRGELSLGAVSVSALSDFPQLTMTAEQVAFTGEGDFAGETLLDAERVAVTLDLWAAISGRYVIETLAVERGQLALHVSSSGAASWDVFEEGDDSSDSPLVVDVRDLALRDVAIAWLDAPGESTGMVEGLTGAGTLSLRDVGMVVSLEGAADAVTYTLDGIDYLDRSSVLVDATLISDAAGEVYTFADNRITLNALPLTLEGSVGLAEDGLDLDLRYTAADSDFVALLSAIPALYARSFDSIDAAGAFTASGTIVGRSTETLLPALTLDMTVTDGSFRYPGLPGAMTGLTVDASLSSPAGPSLDDLSIDLRTLRGVMLDQPFSGRLRLTDTQADPLIDAALKLDLDLSRLGELIPLSADESYTGRLVADVAIAGRTSAASAERYADFSASGPVTLDGVRYVSPDFPHPLDIGHAELALTPAGLRIDTLSLSTGSSDAVLVGQIDDLLAYVFEDAPLKGAVSVESRRLDLGDLSEESEEAEAGHLVIPDGYALTLDIDADQLIYDDLTFSDVSGQIDLRDSVATMRGLSMRGLGGGLGIDGSYTGRSSGTPRLDLTLSLDRLEVAELADRLDLSARLVPLLDHAQGALSADLTFAGQLDETMTPVLSSLDSAGLLLAKTLTLQGDVPVLGAIADTLESPGLRETTVSGVKMRYAFDDGRIQIDPTTLTLGGYSGTLSGSQGLDQSIDFALTLDLPTADARGVVAGLLDGLGSITLPKTIPVTLALTGTLTAPKVSASLAVTREQILAGAIDAASQLVLGRGADEAISAAAQAVLSAAQAKADAVLSAAQAASDKLLAEADRQADALVDAASGALAKSLAEKAADALRQEARKKSRQLLKKAEAEAESILEKAEAEAARL